jgi:hypothetical protein
MRRYRVLRPGRDQGQECINSAGFQFTRIADDRKLSQPLPPDTQLIDDYLERNGSEVAMKLIRVRSV